ncbi:hypothetical protein So717_35290 [Roseobacter cerasinus]|uniref:Uncharacterized protein n=1 Tax=Roseobacter cerasinus TaxID=2602289 RepID=A0A640VZY8_9RHOB|nr:hypothetical protein [Roseobacter cerasinus]GFE51776.1 hypothetical protein So717_35290 [Roseobacter cerasinus]
MIRRPQTEVGKVWSPGSDTPKNPGSWEGEQRNMWTPAQVQTLWLHGGKLHQSRQYSRFLSPQIKAPVEGVATPVNSLQDVHQRVSM